MHPQHFCKLASGAWHSPWYQDHVPSFEHESVLVEEVLKYLSPREDGVYVDCTLGGAGHASRLSGTLVGIDRDPAALEAARARLGDRGTLVHGELGDITRILGELGISKVEMPRRM